MNWKPLARHLWKEWGRPVTLPALAILAAKSALADINYVPSGSMKPTILEGDVLFVDKRAYDLRVPFTLWRVATWGAPARGDVVVCFAPDSGDRLVKRVVGVPGDTIELRNNTLFVNGRAADYGPAAADVRAALSAADRASAVVATEIVEGRAHAVMSLPGRPAARSFAPAKIPADRYLVLGDNRDNSHDSRFFGFVERRQIVGEAKAVVASGDLDRWLKPRPERFGKKLQ